MCICGYYNPRFKWKFKLLLKYVYGLTAFNLYRQILLQKTGIYIKLGQYFCFAAIFCPFPIKSTYTFLLVSYGEQKLYGQMVPTILLDGFAKNVTSKFDYATSDLIITIPHFWKEIGMIFVCLMR